MVIKVIEIIALLLNRNLLTWKYKVSQGKQNVIVLIFFAIKVSQGKQTGKYL